LNQEVKYLIQIPLGSFLQELLQSLLFVSVVGAEAVVLGLVAHTQAALLVVLVLVEVWFGQIISPLRQEKP
jgi:hypothetical protein